MRRLALLWVMILGGSAAAEEPSMGSIFTEGAPKVTAKKGAVIDMQSFIRLARTLGPSVVNVIAIASTEGDARELVERQQQQQQQTPPGERRRGRGQGTGFIIHKSGYVLTNTHVIESADDIRVRLSDERELFARLVGKDERTDIALLKIEAGADLPVAPLGNSDEVQIGEWVVAIGNPFGLDHTVTAGIVSAKGRRDVRPGGTASGFYDFIQTDASINPGNSGGPLINTHGEVIGINTAMNAAAQGIGFAIPINMAKVIAPLLAKHGRAPRAWLGVFPQPISAQLRRAFNLPDTRGALLADVVAESPAARSGLVTGDVVLSFHGRPIRRADDLMWLVSTAPAGRPLSLTVLRGGRTFRIDTTPLPAPDETPPAAAKPAADKPKKSPFGMTVSEISPGIARELGKPTLQGVVVMSVEPDSPALEAGVERGDLILRVDDLATVSLDDYARAVRPIAHGAMIRLLIRRDGKNLWLAFLKR